MKGHYWVDKFRQMERKEFEKKDWKKRDWRIVKQPYSSPLAFDLLMEIYIQWFQSFETRFLYFSRFKI